MNSERAGILYVLSAPSGAGKTTLLASLRRFERFQYSVSCTTRSPRPGEVDGSDYLFLSEGEFERHLERDEFLEHAEVHGRRYGTLRAPVVESLRAGIDVLIDIDTQGAEQIRRATDPCIASCLVDIFVMPPGIDEIRRRLEQRGTETPEQIGVRLRNAEEEMSHWACYKYTVLSGSPEQDLATVRAIMSAERCRSDRLQIELSTPIMR